MVVIRPRNDEGFVSAAAVYRPLPSVCKRFTQASRVSAPIHSASVSGRWMWGRLAEIARVLGSGSRPLMKRVSTPVLMYTNGRGVTGGFSPAGRPAAYLPDWSSTPLRVWPAGLASIAPTALPFTNSR